MSILKNNTAIARLQNTVISLVQVNDISIFAAIDEVKKILNNTQSSFTGDYKERLLETQVTEDDIDTFFNPDRLTAINAFNTISNTTLKEAFKVVFAVPPHLLPAIPKQAQFSRDIVESIILDITTHGVSVAEVCTSILYYFERKHKFSVLGNEHLTLLSNINYYHVKNIFTPDFINSLSAQAEKLKLDVYIDYALDSYSENIYQRIDDNSSSMILAYRNWLRCHEENECEALLQESYFIDAMQEADADAYFAKHPIELDQLMVEHLKQNPVLLDTYLPAASGTLTMTLLNHLAEYAAVYEIGAMALLGLFLFRKQIAQLKPSKLFSFFGFKAESPPPTIRYTLLRQTNA